jgi:hypothetical protein
MPFALIIIGLVLVVSAVRDTTGDLVTVVKGDFTGPNNFSYWLVAMLIIGGLGYVPSLEKLSRLFLVLVVLGLFLSHGGFFEQFNAQAFGGGLASNDGLPPLPSLGSLATPQDWSKGYQVPGNLGIETPLSSGRNTGVNQ